MFSRHYFAARYFAPRYFPGEALVSPEPVVVSAFNWMDSAPNRMRSSENWMTSDTNRLRSEK